MRRYLMGAWAAVALAAVLMASASALAGPADGPVPSDGPGASYFLHTDSNFDLLVQDFLRGWDGDGSEGEPFIIPGPGYPVDAQGYASCIYIGNTTYHFRIIAWDIFNCSAPITGASTFNPGAAIVLYNVLGNSSIEDCDLSDNPIGAWVDTSTEITLLNNTCRNSTIAGLAMLNSDGAWVHGNRISNCSQGILLQATAGSSLSQNNCSGCVTGIHVDQGSDDLLSLNNCSSSSRGILVESSPRTAVRNCTLWNDTLGIEMGGSQDGSMRGNRHASCEQGAWIRSSPGARAEWNSFASCAAGGLNVSGSDGLHASNNSFSGPGQGLMMISSGQAMVRNNQLSGCLVGMEASSSPQPTFLNNTIDACPTAIRIEGSISAIVLGNQIKGPAAVGIDILASSSDALASENEVEGGGIGIQVVGSDRPVLVRNRVEGCAQGALVRSSADLSSSLNSFTSNGRGIELNATSGARLDQDILGGNSECGAFIYGSSGAWLTWCNLSDNPGCGLVSMVGSGLRVENCSLFDNGISGLRASSEVGMRLAFDRFGGNGAEGALLASCTSPSVVSNVFRQETVMLRLVSGSGASVRGNQFLSALQDGLVMTSASGAVVSENLFQGCGGYAVDATSCSSSIFHLNILAGNRGSSSSFDDARRQARDDSPSDRWNTTLQGNHWTDLTAPDLDRDGIADVPYPLGGSSDLLPLSGPIGPVTSASASAGKVYVLLAWSYPNPDFTVIYPLSHFLVERRNSTSTVTFPLIPPFQTELNDTTISAQSDYQYTIHAVSSFGRSVGIVLNVQTVDVTPPAVTIASPAAGSALSAASIPARWSATDIGGGVARYEIQVDETAWRNMDLATEADLAPLPQGWHNLTVRAFDQAGNNGTARVTFYVDAYPPSLAILEPRSGAILNQTSVLVRWAASDNGTGILGYQFRLDQGAWSSLQAQNSTQILVPAGAHVISVMAWDRVNSTQTASVGLTVDPYPPTVTITSPAAGVTRDGNVRLAYSAQDNLTSVSGYWVQVDGGGWLAMGMNLSLDLVLAEGEHLLEVRAMDLAGNIGMADRTIEVDATAPLLLIESPLNGTYVRTKNVQVSWNVTELAASIAWYELRMDGGGWLNMSLQTGFLTPALSEGPHLVEVRAVDRAGNVGGNSTAFMVDTIAPSVQWLGPAYGTLLNRLEVLALWNASDDNSGLNTSFIVVDDLDPVEIGLVTNHTVLLQGEGGHGIFVRVYDLAGNSRLEGVRVTVDMTPPLLRIDYPQEGAIVQAREINVLWVGSDPGTGLSRFYGAQDQFTWADFGMSFSHVFSGLGDGRHVIYIRAFDNAGNFLTRSVNFTVDMTQPVVQIQYPANNGWVNSTEVEVRWTGSDTPLGMAYYLVRLDNGSWTYVGLNTSLRLAGLNLSAHLVEVKGFSNSSQNTTAASLFRVDLAPPSAPEVIDPNRYVNTGRISFAWAPATDGESGVSSYEVRVDRTHFNGTAYVTSNGTWTSVGSALSYLSTGNPDGWYNLSVRARDRGGNAGPADLTEMVLDTVVPRALSFEPIGSAVPLVMVIEVRFSEPMSTSTVDLDLGAGVAGGIAWEGSMVMRFTPSQPLAYATVYQVQVDGRDLAGNSMTPLRYQFATIPDLGTVSGKVVNERGFPIQGAIVSLDSGQTAATDIDGGFELEASSGVHTLRIRYEGYGEMSMNVTLTAGAALDLGEMPLSQATTDFSWLIIVTFVLLVAVAIELIYLQRKRRPK